MMTHDAAGKQQADSTNHLKSVFEQSLAVLRDDKNEDKSKGKNNDDERTSQKRLVRSACGAISCRCILTTLTSKSAALDEAAKALASLWKISGAGHTKLPGRVLVSHK